MTGAPAAAGDQVERLHDEAAAVLARYGRADAELELLSISENATFAVDDPRHGRAALRLHRHGYLTREQIAAELAWTEALREQAGVATPRALPALDGERIVTLRYEPLADERNAVLFEWVEGAAPAADGLAAWAPALGELAARIHAHGAAWTPPAGFHRHTWLTEQIVGDGARWGSWRDHPGVDADARELLERAVAVARARLDAVATDRDRFGLVHADLRLANVLADGDRLTVIDFDDCGHGWFLWDLAGAFRGIPTPPDRDAIVAGWLEGYRSVRPVAADVAAEVEGLLLLSRLQGLGWLANRQATDLARDLDGERIATTCALAERYLTAN
ncbi:MAG: phosphotransferase [Solirubrobacterales bacterium]|nr:phosphotransferase [Solirubrobacterales bacterium]